MPPRQCHLVCALDYGTSNSGAAYSLCSDETAEEDIAVDIISPWPHGGASRKVSSDISYDSNGTAVGFGHDIPPGARRLQWVKPLFEPQHLPKRYTAKTSRVWDSFKALSREELNKTPEDVATDYLTWLWKEVKREVEDKEDRSDIFESARLTVVLTVPPSWSERAKSSLRKAAGYAGIPETSIRMIAEPEAAAIHSLRRRAKKGQLADGDCFIVCDAGGGTVDVVAYQVHSASPLSLNQVTESKGEFCGSVFVDAEFQNQIRMILGEKYDELSPEDKQRIEEEFELQIKRKYNPNKSQAYYVPVPGLQDDATRKIRNGKLEVPEAALRESFEAIFHPIMMLVDEQVDTLQEKGLASNLRGILLVGGFSGSEYLHTRMKQAPPGGANVKIWRDDDTSTAVVQGAVAYEASGRAKTAIVHTRLSPHNYGIPYRIDGAKRVQWLVRKGQPVQTNATTEPYGLRMDDQDWLEHDEHCLLFVPLVRSDEDDASDNYGPLVIPHAEIQCRVNTSLRKSEEARLVQETPTKAWLIPATLALILDGAVISFSCRVQGQEVGVADVTYFQDLAEQDLGRSAASSLSGLPGLSVRTDSVADLDEATELIEPVTPVTERARSSSSSKRSSLSLHTPSWLVGIRTKKDASKVKPVKPRTYSMDPCLRLVS